MYTPVYTTVHYPAAAANGEPLLAVIAALAQLERERSARSSASARVSTSVAAFDCGSAKI